MIIGFGHDLVDIRRIEKLMDAHPQRFLEKHFSNNERTLIETRAKTGRALDTAAKRYAAKEACAKALGTGIAHNVALSDISVENDAEGRPTLVLSGGALERLIQITPEGHQPRTHISLSDEPPYASATVIIEVFKKV